jgi:ABC-2 type transport system permease protein
MPQLQTPHIFQGISLKEEPIHEWGVKNAHINSVQHNVPAWAIFGMFFIVIPIAGNMIKEREEGSAMRIAIIPGAYTYVALGKILFYTLVCVVQFMVMVAIGLWVLPMLGLPALYLGQYPLLLLLVVFFIAYAATAFGYFSGVVFLTNNQAMPFGAISIVILSAIGGIWVPVELLPGIMQKVAYISPLYWGMQGVQQLVLRDAGFTGIALPLLVLFLFGSALWLVSVAINNGNRHKRY